MDAMTYTEAIEHGAKKLNELYYLFGNTQHVQYFDGINKGFYLALAMVYGETPQLIESAISEQ